MRRKSLVLSMRAAIERDSTYAGDDSSFDGFSFTGSDSPDAPPSPEVVSAAMPCFVWGNRGSTAFTDDVIASIGDYTMIVGWGEDIQELDRITSIKNDRGDDFLVGAYMRVMHVIPSEHWDKRAQRFLRVALETIA